MTVTAVSQWVNSRNAQRREVTPWNKCLACENSVHEHKAGPWGLAREDARYCSNACRQRAYRKRKKPS